MKVLACIRPDYKTNIGGDTIQFSKTVEYLKKKGLDVRISTNPHENLKPYDLVHIFNTIRIRDIYEYYRRAKAYKKKIVLTPIYWNYGLYLYKNLNHSKFKMIWAVDHTLRREIIKNVDLILPSSKLELDMIQKDFKVNTLYKIVYNGVDSYFSKGKPEKFLNQYELKEKDFILSVGRICPHKNQLTLSRICKSMNIPLVTIGPINDLDYFKRCIEANPSLIHINELNHEDLASAYSAAKVHCLVSWYETPGLVNLEAGIAGCHILTTPEGSTKEYFKDYIEYAQWNDYEDIEKKIIKLLNRKRSDELKNYILNNFLWEDIAESIIHAYRMVIH